ncbi:MAG: hydrogenase [Desulfamplus sp.]|nr:hydrogenase [Desulfamplus sp.]
MVKTLIILPFIAGIIAFFIPKKAGRKLLVAIGLIHLIASILLWIERPTPPFPDYFAITPEGLLSLLVISLLFFLISIYSQGYLKAEEQHLLSDHENLISNTGIETIKAEKIFIGSILIFLSTMTMVTLSDHIMVMWIAIEATTLASAPLIYFHRTAASLEATWKYVIICSVGIAMALLGSIFIAIAMDVGQVNAPVSFSALTSVAKHLDPIWLKTGFVFILVGYGTKMGLAPMHTWLPDAHSEAPSPASALLSGVLLNCAYLGIFKTNKIMHEAGLGDFSGNILMTFGLISIIAAATFILKQTEYKRLLAYSSIENMGIIAFGTGIGGMGVYGALLCLIHHSLIKSSLFLTSGNMLLGYGTKLIKETGNMVKLMPKSFVAFFAGFAGIAGFPPFGIFIGEFFIIMAAFRSGHFVAAGIFILTLCIIFAGFSNQMMKISFGPSDHDNDTAKFSKIQMDKIRSYRVDIHNKIDIGKISTDKKHMEQKLSMILPQYLLLLTSIILCFWMPDSLYQTIMNAVASMGGLK